jgi:signal recognition particle subunit SEC65
MGCRVRRENAVESPSIKEFEKIKQRLQLTPGAIAEFGCTHLEGIYKEDINQLVISASTLSSLNRSSHSQFFKELRMA